MKEIIISIILSLLLALFALIKHAMTYPALLLAFIFSSVITYFGGIPAFLMLTTVFLGVVIASIIAKLVHKKEEKMEKKHLIQIIANVAPGAITLIFYGIFNNSSFLVVYASVMAEALADSLASDIGILSKKDPINILTSKKSKPGLSGNVSLLGLSSALIGSFVIGLIYYLLINSSVANLLIITIAGFLGALLDSFLGATIQVKYKCSKCQSETEKKIHCSTETEKVKGLKFIDNNMVNLLSNILTGILVLLFISL